MTFWLVVAVLCLAAVAFAVLPLWKSAHRLSPRAPPVLPLARDSRPGPTRRRSFHSPVDAGPPFALYAALSNTCGPSTSCIASQGDGVGVIARNRCEARNPGTLRMSRATCPMYQVCQSCSRAASRKSISTM